jgi:hypothetical protein
MHYETIRNFIRNHYETPTHTFVTDRIDTVTQYYDLGIKSIPTTPRQVGTRHIFKVTTTIRRIFRRRSIYYTSGWCHKHEASHFDVYITNRTTHISETTIVKI